MPMRLLPLIALLLLVAAPAARAQSGLDAAAEALKSDPVYVDPQAEAKLSDSEADQLRQRITDKDAGPMYVAVMPRDVVSGAGGSIGQALTELGTGVNRSGTYVLVAGRSVRAGSTRGVAPEGATAEAMDAALKAHKSEGLDAILLDFTDRMGEVKAGGDAGGNGNGGGGSGSGGLIVFGALAAGGGGLLLARRRRRRRGEAQELEEVHGTVRGDVVELGDEIRALDLDVQMPGVPEEAKTDYEAALGAYERASAAVDRARTPQELEPVGAAVEGGAAAVGPRPHAAGARAGGRRRGGAALRDGLRAGAPRGQATARADPALLLRPAPRPVLANRDVRPVVGRAPRGAGLRGRCPARRARRGARPAPDHGRRPPGPVLERRPRVRPVHGRILRRKPASGDLPRLDAGRRHIRRLRRLGPDGRRLGRRRPLRRRRLRLRGLRRRGLRRGGLRR